MCSINSNGPYSKIERIFNINNPNGADFTAYLGSYGRKMELKITTNFIPLILAYDDLPNGVQLIRQPVMERRDISYSSIAVGILSFASGVSASLVASWIYEKIKKLRASRTL